MNLSSNKKDVIDWLSLLSMTDDHIKLLDFVSRETFSCYSLKVQADQHIADLKNLSFLVGSFQYSKPSSDEVIVIDFPAPLIPKLEPTVTPHLLQNLAGQMYTVLPLHLETDLNQVQKKNWELWHDAYAQARWFISIYC